ncbi:MAG: 30S ribosomal protein S16 [Candidatus Handelsmanbacteria bacterium RIFCSPLOWO2_12_FULL_64_10]|uniref:Small ribosomal subunit protein bS16 n=1 Tax=Handelsmanbacteria sp. (strain RIFCSPLOWO2_12_FULL_64_10) TaxID=1817868 RepID=A0A1F6CRA6_HANXR|nr:MAG: 30S ribosomal protein S16 [Candidatus Handelsmanbacteria bacterium RIFCSPLOWO2_12_FULL_64_10]
MAVKIRLKRIGAKKAPFYRLVAATDNVPRDGKTIDELGYYNPLKNPPIVNINEEQVFLWLRRGAIPTDTARSLLRNQGLLQKWDAMRKGKTEPSAPTAAEG